VLLVLLAISGHSFFDGAIFGALALFLTKYDVFDVSYIQNCKDMKRKGAISSKNKNMTK